MSEDTQTLLADLKRLVEAHVTAASPLSTFQTYVSDIFEMQLADVDYGYLFQKTYLHACLKGAEDIAVWLQTVGFSALDPIQQIFLRQVFAYGGVILRLAKARDAASSTILR